MSEDDAKRAILARRARFVTAALASAGLAAAALSGCGGETDRDQKKQTSDAGDAAPLPCLGTPAPDADPAPCLSAPAPDSGPEPCLGAPAPDASPEPCLDFDPDASFDV